MQKEKRGQVTSSTSLRHRQTPILLKRVNAHAFQRELSTSVLAIFFLKFGEFQKQESKSGCSLSYMSLMLRIVISFSAHRHLQIYNVIHFLFLLPLFPVSFSKIFFNLVTKWTEIVLYHIFYFVLVNHIIVMH